MQTEQQQTRKTLALDYRTVWRWHFYAGLFCIPFILWLSITGSIYLFRPQFEAWQDRPYNHLSVTGPTADPAAQAQAAVAAVPGSALHDFQLPNSPSSAVQIIVGRGKQETRVYVHPQTLKILHIADEDKRLMRRIFYLHGELLLGDKGSFIVELAASWAIVLLISGLYLWWPRKVKGLGGVLYPRLSLGGRLFWRDLHAVVGLWISFFALFLLFTGLPWSKSWGGYLKAVRSLTGESVVRQDWTTGRSSELAQRMAMDTNTRAAIAMEHAAHTTHGVSVLSHPSDYLPLNASVPVVSALHLAYPVLISPPTKRGGNWTAKSDAQNRTLRTNLVLDAATGRIVSRQDFDQRPWIDRAVGIGVAAHEGQLFGWLNQLVELCTALGLITLCVSAVAMWWKRRPQAVLGAPVSTRKVRLAWPTVALIILFCLYLPLLAISLLLVCLVERFVLRRIEGTRSWLGLGQLVRSGPA
jgi:uncharacterized iron-regulated membrane protein